MSLDRVMLQPQAIASTRRDTECAYRYGYKPHQLYGAVLIVLATSVRTFYCPITSSTAAAAIIIFRTFKTIAILLVVNSITLWVDSAAHARCDHVNYGLFYVISQLPILRSVLCVKIDTCYYLLYANNNRQQAFRRSLDNIISDRLACRSMTIILLIP